MGHSTQAQNPTGGAGDRRGDTQPSLHENLMESMVDRANVQRAWKRVKANRGAPGVDGMTIDDFPAFVRSHWPAIRQVLLEGTYQPSPVRRVSIPKPAGRSWGVSMAYRLSWLAKYLRDWMNYFGISDDYKPILEIDSWLRRRVRMCYWKQWRRVRTKVGKLLRMGTRKREAILTAISRKSYWHLSKSLATQTGMTNVWLASQGLLSVRDLWMKAHGYV